MNYCFSVNVQSYRNEKGESKVELKNINIGDPFIMPHDGTYYMYGKKVDGTQNFCVYKSKDLVEWSLIKTVFLPSEKFEADRV